MQYDSAIRTAAQLTTEARANQNVIRGGFALERFFPTRSNPSLSFDFDVNQTTLPRAASYRAFDAEAGFSSTEGGERRSGKLPPISIKHRVDEYDTLVQQVDGPALIQGVFDERTRGLSAQVQTRVELARGEALEFGRVTLKENKLQATIDFGRSAALSVTAATLWSDPAADVLGDLQTWLDTFDRINGGPWAEIVGSTAIRSRLQRNTGIIKAAMGRGTDLPPAVSVDDVNSVLSSWGFGTYTVNDEQVRDVAGNTKRVISQNKLVFVAATGGPSLTGAPGSSGIGTTDFGITAESVNPIYGIGGTDRAGLFAAAYQGHDPEGKYVLVSAVVLPVLSAANSTMTAQVLA
jgi:hypothetical protein